MEGTQSEIALFLQTMMQPQPLPPSAVDQLEDRKPSVLPDTPISPENRHFAPIANMAAGPAQPSPEPSSVNSPAQPRPARAGTTASARSSPPPTTILFGGNADSPDEYIIPAKHVAQLPPAVREKLIKDCEVLEGKNMQIVTLTSTMWLDALLRLSEYLDHKDYAPFTPYTPLKVVNDVNAEVEWKKNQPIDKYLRSTDDTFQLFSKELRLYAFAVSLDYSDLREFSSAKIRTAYPIFAREILALIDDLYITALRIKDSTLIKFIKDTATRHSDKLVQHTRFTELFRDRMTQIQDPITRMLLDVQLAASSKSSADRFLAEQSRTILPPTGPRDTDSRKSEDTEDIPKLLSTLYEFLLEDRLVIARMDGYGTLLQADRGYSRNKDFTFAKSEILVTDTSRKAFNGKHNITVTNCRGQRGDILGTLVEPVPANLGATHSEFEPVNLGKRPREASPPQRPNKHIKSEHSPPSFSDRIDRDSHHYR